MEKENKVKEFFEKYMGAIIGGIIALALVFTGLIKLLVAVVIIVIGVFAGYYIQNNKDYVKDKLKEFIDKF